MTYLAIMNVPGYLPMEDEPPTFDTAQEAWSYLADEREQGEDAEPLDADGTESGEYSDTHRILRYIASGEHLHGDPNEDWPTNPDGTGVVYGGTPGSTSEHDLGIAYSVVLAEA